ncbi:MAG: DUF3375 domain-containing protein [Bacteroidota bacterium]
MLPQEKAKILGVLQDSPSVELLRLRSADQTITFFMDIFSREEPAISFERIHLRLADFLSVANAQETEEVNPNETDSYEDRAKIKIREWTDRGFLTNYRDAQGVEFYELSSHTQKTLDWLSSLKKEDFVGTESKFKSIFNGLKELVEFTNEDTQKRLELLEAKKQELEEQIAQIRAGQEIKVFEEYEIIPRFQDLNQSAKELLSDFREVGDNFKDITKEIYQKHAQGSQKDEILRYTFDALDELRDSAQGKSFYAFWTFLRDQNLQNEWEDLTATLYQTLEAKKLPANDLFLRRLKKYLYQSGKKVYEANDKMAVKLSRIIRENEASKTEATKKVLQEIKTLLVQISRSDTLPDVSFELETKAQISIPFERKITEEENKNIRYTQRPEQASVSMEEMEGLTKLFSRPELSKAFFRANITAVLQEKPQATLVEIIQETGGIKNGLSELFGYFGVLKDFPHHINEAQQQAVIFDEKSGKHILIPEIILSR